MLVAGCVTTDDKGRAIEAINKAFRVDYEAILAKCGTRVYEVTRAEGYDAVRISLARLGMTVESQDPALGYVNVFAPAPRPLNLDEWARAADADLAVCAARNKAFVYKRGVKVATVAESEIVPTLMKLLK